MCGACMSVYLCERTCVLSWRVCMPNVPPDPAVGKRPGTAREGRESGSRETSAGLADGRAARGRLAVKRRLPNAHITSGRYEVWVPRHQNSELDLQPWGSSQGEPWCFEVPAGPGPLPAGCRPEQAGKVAPAWGQPSKPLPWELAPLAQPRTA